MRVGVLILGEERRDFFQRRISIVDDESQKLYELIDCSGYELLKLGIVFTYKQARDILSQCIQKEVNAVIVHIPIWGDPSLVIPFVNHYQQRLILVGNNRPDSSSMVAFLAASGAINQIGKRVNKVFGNIDEAAFQKEMICLLKAIEISTSLQNCQLGVIGGRSIGINTTVGDYSLLGSKWGIDVKHFDQLEIASRVPYVNSEEVAAIKEWLGKKLSRLEFSGKFNPESFDLQIRSYMALNDIVKENSLDMIALKCQPELSNGLAVQCLGVSLINNTFDHTGNRIPVPCSCESDMDGALTMKILQFCTGNSQPCSLVDIRSYNPEKKVFIFANCGAMAFAYASLDDADEACSKIEMKQHVFGKGGGSVSFICQEGPVTLARLFRVSGKYALCCIEGEACLKQIENNKVYPHLFVECDIDLQSFVQSMGSNHMHVVYGRYKDILRKFCEIEDISFLEF